MLANTLCMHYTYLMQLCNVKNSENKFWDPDPHDRKFLNSHVRCCNCYLMNLGIQANLGQLAVNSRTLHPLYTAESTPKSK